MSEVGGAKALVYGNAEENEDDNDEEDAEGQLICRVSCDESIGDAAASNCCAGVLFILETVKKTVQVFIHVIYFSPCEAVCLSGILSIPRV